MFPVRAAWGMRAAVAGCVCVCVCALRVCTLCVCVCAAALEGDRRPQGCSAPQPGDPAAIANAPTQPHMPRGLAVRPGLRGARGLSHLRSAWLLPLDDEAADTVLPSGAGRLF